ncbi:protein transporter tim10 [Pleurotus ostreatus]|uniref:Mitochondrial import inner membrane translocase subunit n=2 Tax=Pleurotus ostreatus TaxID=5322 RepID=A0A067NRK4_PLEO1|nr:protein transporter tim10 [Pleurotus ostreatus]KAF7437059.1 protein transporter tim10 [Pleurotus ostreatus]KDQ30559.1 hypothetical protein PLEOSDRAFT_1101545 [Pleurotus ostreatus PC15]
MSFLGRGPGGPSNGVNPERIEMAITELDTVTDFFNRMVSFVFLVCVCISTRYADQDLNKGESVCIDRCVAKFNEVQKKVGEKLQSRGAAASGGGAGSFTGL